VVEFEFEFEIEIEIEIEAEGTGVSPRARSIAKPAASGWIVLIAGRRQGPGSRSTTHAR